MLAIAVRILCAFAALSVLVCGSPRAMADGKHPAYRVDLQLKDGDAVVISPSLALLAGSQGEITLSAGESGAIYRTRVSAAPMQVGDGKEGAVMVSVAISILDGNTEIEVTNSQLGVRMGTPATMELEQPGVETDLSLEVRVQRFEIEGSVAVAKACGDQVSSTAAGSVQGN